MGANDPRGGAIFDPRGMIGRIYIEDHYTLLHTKYESCISNIQALCHAVAEKVFSYISIISLW